MFRNTKEAQREFEALTDIDYHDDLSLSDYPLEDNEVNRLVAAGCLVDETPVDVFLTRPDFGFAYSQEEFA